MRFKNSILLFSLFVVLFLLINSFQVMADPIDISNQAEFQNAISDTYAELEMNFKIPELTLTSNWNPNVNSNIHTLNIITLSDAFTVKPVDGLTTRFLYFSTDAKISLDSQSTLLIKNFSNEISGSNSYGGAIYSIGNLTLEKGRYFFIENSAPATGPPSRSYGGAIYSSKNLTFLEGTFNFDGNSANAVTLGYRYTQGGAIYSNGDLTFSEGIYSFNENTVSGNGITSGGAIYSNGSMKLVGGTYTFIENKAIDAGSYPGHGGAIYSNGALTLSSDTCIFINNSAYGSNGFGGAIYAYENLTFEKGTYSFIENSVSGTDVSSNNYGGAIYVSREIAFWDGIYMFKNNNASGPYSSGGAIYVNVTGDLKFLDGNYFFVNNISSGTGASSHSYGGGIYSGGEISFSDGRYIFKSNEVSGVYSYGGAIYASKNLTLSGGTYSFIKNSVAGTSEGNGGAIYASGDLAIAGGLFIDNTASHHGGAIFINSTSSNPIDVKIAATEDYPILFKGNNQNTNFINEPNSIYWGGNGDINAVFSVEKNASFVMYDPLHSNQAVTFTLTKKGEGVWQLGGHSILDGKGKIFIEEGVLRLLPSSIIELTDMTSSFTTSAGTEIQVVANLEPVYISAGNISLNGYISMYSDPRYSLTGAALEEGNKVVLLHVNVINGNNISSYIDEIQPAFSDVITIGAYEYVLDDDPLRWEIDEDDPTHGTLSLYLKLKMPNRIVNGSDPLKVPGIEMLSEPMTLNITSRVLNVLSDERGHELWYNVSFLLTKIDTVNLTGINISIGRDEEFFENIIIGMGYSLTQFTYKEKVTYGDKYLEICANSINPALVLYSGAELFSKINVISQISYGINLIDQCRDVYVDEEKESLSSSYSTYILKASVNLDYSIALGRIDLKPTIGYEFMNLFAKSHAEKSIYKENAIAGSLALIYSDLRHVVHQVTTGIKGLYNFEGIMLEGKLMYIRLFGDLYAKTNNMFVENSDEEFTAEGRVGYAHNLNFGLIVKLGLTEKVNVFLEYNGMYNKIGYSHMIKFNFSHNFHFSFTQH